MSDLSPALRAFLRDAIVEKLERERRAKRYPDGRLWRDVQAFTTWLVLSPQSPSSGLEGTADAAGSGTADSDSAGHGALPLAMSRDAAARELGVSAKTVDRLIAKGVLPASKAGRRVVIARSAVEDYLKREAS
jgi:excisionase family DNA binding protein